MQEQALSNENVLFSLQSLPLPEQHNILLLTSFAKILTMSFWSEQERMQKV
jgi:hypothetical protein